MYLVYVEKKKIPNAQIIKWQYVCDRQITVLTVKNNSIAFSIFILNSLKIKNHQGVIMQEIRAT